MQGTFEFGALLAFAIPGTVLGVSYVLAFNVPPFELTGTGLVIVLCFVFRNLPVGVRAGTAAFKQEAWIEAQARGLAVKGYEPTADDRRDLAARRVAREELQHR